MATERYRPITMDETSLDVSRIFADALPDLPYDLDALEPFLSAEALRVHHGNYHRGYVDELNSAQREVNLAREQGDYARMRAICDSLAFNYSGHMLHSLHWKSMSTLGGGVPNGALAEQIAADFEDQQTFVTRFSETALAVQGSGWVILAWQPQGQKLTIIATEKHQNVAEWGAVPVLALDMWEHAYYLDHKDNRAEYVRGFFEVVDWPGTLSRFEEA